MMQRQNREQLICRADFHHAAERHDILADVPLAKHNPLSHTGRAGGEKERAKALRIDRRFFHACIALI